MILSSRRLAFPFVFAGAGVASVLVACGGASSNAPADGANGAIASMPAYPDASAPSAPSSATTTAAATSASTDPKQLCAGATPVTEKPAASSFLQSPRSLDDLLIKSTVAATDRTSAPNAKAGTYSMADLQALDKKSSWDEILDHAEDVAPTQRNAAWDKVVEDAATGYLASATTKTDSFEGIFASQALLQRYPHLTTSPAFMAKRADAGKMAAQTCLENAYRGQHCIDMMKDFLKTPGTDASVGFAFGKIARKNQNAYVAVPFFDWALTKTTGDKTAMCADDDLQLATIAGLGLPTEYDNAAGARRIAEGACWPTMKDAVNKGFVDSPGGYYRDNACAVLKAKGAL